jgi:hypothetical protein
MAIKYPSITPASTDSSPNANHLAIKLPTTQGNGIFNTFTLDYDGERQTAYSVIVIQNAQVQATPSVMNVSSIELSADALANGFSLDPVDTSGNLEMGANVTLNGIAGAPVDGINRIKAVSAITNFNAAVSDGGDIAFNTATHCLLLPPLTQNGGAAHGGVNANALASPEILLDQLNTTATSAASGTFRVLPLYKTTDITAGSGETNPINQNEYAAFVIRYAPGENQAPSSIELSTLTITTSAGTSVIGLSYSASNIFTPSYQFGRYSFNTGTLLLEGSDYVSKPSGATLAMGLFPVGTDVTTTSSARHLLRVNDQSPQTTNSATNVSDSFSMLATTIQDATPFNFLESTQLNNVGEPWVDSDVQLITDAQAIDNAYWYMTLMYSSTGAVNGSSSSLQIHGNSVNEAPFDFTKAEATMAAQIKFSWSVMGPTSPSFLNHLFKVTGGFYYQLSLNASGGVLTNNTTTVAPNHRRRALRTQSIGILGPVAQDTMFSGDKFNLKIICNYQNYSGAAFATASVSFATQFPLTKGTHAYADGDYIFPNNYKPNTSSTTTIDIPASTAWNTSAILDEKQDFVIEVPVQANEITNKALYSNDSYNSTANLFSGTNFLAGRSIDAGVYRTNPGQDIPGGRQNDGSYSAEVAIDGNIEGYFTDKLGPYSQSYFVEFYPIQARIKCHARPSDAEDGLQIDLSAQYGYYYWQYNLQSANYSNFYNPRTLQSIAAADLTDNPLFETGQATHEPVTNWYQVGSATAVPNTAAAFHSIDANTDAIQSGVDYSAGNNLDEVFFSGANGAVIKNEFKTAANSYFTNPSLATYDSQTNTKTSRFEPDNTIMVKAAKYHAADQHWYADVDLKFDNSGQEETLLWRTKVEASNLVDAASAPVKPSGANTPAYKVVTIKSGTPSTYSASSTGLYSTITDGTRIPDLYKNTIGTSIIGDKLNAAFAIIPPKRKGVGETATSGYAASHFKRPYPSSQGDIQATYGGFTKIRFKLDNNSSAAGNYYAMVTVESIDNSFDNNMQWDDEDSIFKSADIDHPDFKLSVHRFIIKFTVSPNSDLVVTDSDTSDNLEANSTINFGNITVG